MLSQVAFFMAYFVVSLPAAGIIARLGNTRSILLALAIMIIGCLTMPVATATVFAIVLVGLFIIAGGITILQVVANPLAAALGPPERSHFRLTFSQAFNSFGTWLAPMVVSAVLLVGGIFAEGAKCETVTTAMRDASLRKIDLTFFLMAGALVLLGIFIWAFRRHLDVNTKLATAAERPSVLTALKSKWALLGGLAIFLYVGAEVSIGSAMTNFLNYNDMLGVPLKTAGHMVAYYWGGAMIGRFIGSLLLTRVPAPRLLAIFAAIAALMCLAVSQLHGSTAAYIALSIGLFNSIMFPVIFTLTLERSSAPGGDFGPAVPGHRRWRRTAVSVRLHRRRGRWSAPKVFRASVAPIWPRASACMWLAADDGVATSYLAARQGAVVTHPPVRPRTRRGAMDDKARIDQQHSQLCSWLCDAAYPLWSTRGRRPGRRLPRAARAEWRTAGRTSALARQSTSGLLLRHSAVARLARRFGGAGQTWAGLFRDAVSASGWPVPHAGGGGWFIAR